VSPDNFTCPGGEEKKFELAKYSLTTSTPVQTMTDVWDFGDKHDEISTDIRGRGHVSYSYQLPFKTAATGTTGATSFPITTTANPAKAVAADRSPFWDKTRMTLPLTVVNVTAGSTTDPGPYLWINGTGVDKSILYVGNATAHQKEGQNVLFADGHSKFEKGANCGIESDNIYTPWQYTENGTTADATGKKKQVGMPSYTTYPRPHGTATALDIWAQNDEDNFLVNDYN
jgi:prepilin-type processing-associated H-X9-DG protein